MVQQRGVLEAFEQVLAVTERVGAKIQEVNFSEAKPVRGVFGMMSALRRPEVQEGLGVLIELSTVMTALKKDPASIGCSTG